MAANLDFARLLGLGKLSLLHFLEEGKRRLQDEQPSETVLSLVHTASKARILIVAEKYVRQVVRGDYKEVRPEEVEIPIKKEWGFKMGDQVKVKYDLTEFKSISRRTVGWSSSYADIRSHVGVVTSVCSTYDCHIQIYFPDISLMAEIYAGVLEKTQEIPNALVSSRFEVGDTVVIKPSLKNVVQLLQKGIEENLPEEVFRHTGRVIAIGRRGVHVTFSGNFTHEINPAILQKRTGKLSVAEFCSQKGIVEGDRVKVKTNLKKLIEAQQKLREWERWMSKLPQKILRVLVVKDQGLLRVCSEAGRSFHVHTDSVQQMGEMPDQDDDVDVAFPIDEWVMIKKITNFKSVLESKTIPISFLGFLEHPALVSSYQSQSEPGITFDFQYTVNVPSSALEPLSDDKKKITNDMDARKKDWKTDDKVYLNLGPPDYVRDVLNEMDMAPRVVKAMTSVANIRGFSDPRHAVIQCSDGELRRINIENLTVPHKFRHSGNQKLQRQLRQAKELTAIVRDCLKERVFSAMAANEIESISLAEKEQLPVLRFTIRSSIIIKPKEMMRALQARGRLKFESIEDNLIKVHSIFSKEPEITMLVEFNFNHEKAEEGPETSKRFLADPFTDVGSADKELEERFSVEEEAEAAPVKARPGPIAEPPGDDEQARGAGPPDLAGYHHMDLNLNGMHILVPYKFATDQPQERVLQPPSRLERLPQTERSEISRITIEGNIKDVQIE